MIWITTTSGLCRYDGYDIKIYQYNPDDSNSLTHSNIQKPIFEDREGNLWIGTHFGLNKFDQTIETFTRYVHDKNRPGSISSNYINSIYQDKSGIIWIGASLRGELNKYDSATDNFSCYEIIERDTADFYLVFATYEDKNGIFWVATSHGLYQFDRLEETIKPIEPEPPLPDNFIPVYRQIVEDKNGTLWFKSDHAILRYEKRGVDSAVLRAMWGAELQTQTGILHDMVVETSGNNNTLWIAAANGLRWCNPSVHDFIRYKTDPEDPDGLVGYKCPGVFKDESGILWVTSNMGLNILDKQRSQIKQYKEFYDTYQTDANVLFEDNRHNYWIGTWTRGILLFDNQMNLIKQYGNLTSGNSDRELTGTVVQIFEDYDNNLWAGTSRGLYILDKQKNKFEKCLLTRMKIGTKVAPFYVHVIFRDSEGVIWIGTQSGLYKNRGDLQPITAFNNVRAKGLGSYPVRTILEDSYGYLWFGSDGKGLYCKPPELRETDSFRIYRHISEDKYSLSNSNIMSLYEDNNDNLWIGTRNGLNRYNRDTDDFERFFFKTNPAANYIFDITGDNYQNLWLTTQDGLLRLKLEPGNDRYDTTYNLKKFLPFSDIRPRKISRFRDGTFFIGGNYRSENGYFTFNPDSINENKIIPPVVVTDFQINNKPVQLDSNILFKKDIVLSFKENTFSLKFAALDYTDPEQNRYAYYLEGYEDDWIYSGARRDAYYTKVPPGKYFFRAKGSNSDGHWNEEGATVFITITPPPLENMVGVYNLWIGVRVNGLWVKEV